MQINEVVHGRLTAERIKTILGDYRAGKAPDFRKLARTTNALSDYPPSPDELVLLANVDQIDPMSLDDYLARGGYEGLKKALSMTQEEVVNVVKDSGLRGRGGAGFPTGLKWSFTRPSPITPKYIVCNADEGEPGTIKDRYIMEGDPHRVLEGMAIAGYAVGATYGYIYCRGEYYLSMLRLQNAIDQATGQGLSGRQYSWAPTFPSTSRCRPAAALMSAARKPRSSSPSRASGATPGSSPPSPARWASGTNPPSSTTWSPSPACRPSSSTAPNGTKPRAPQDTAGTKIFQVVGHVNKPGIVEANLGMTRPGTHRQIRRRRPGAARSRASSPAARPLGFFLPEQLNTVIEYGAMGKVEGGLGSGTMLVMDDTTCIIDVVKCLLYFFQHESCGFCLPCRRGTRVLYELICKVAAGQGHRSGPGPHVQPLQSHGGKRQLRAGLEPPLLHQDHHGAVQGRIRAHLAGSCPLGCVRPQFTVISA